MLNRTKARTGRLVAGSIVGAATIMATSTVSLADFADTVFTISAESTKGKASFDVTVDMGQVFGDFFMFNFTSPIDLTTESGDVVGRILAGSLQMGGDPFNPGNPDQFIGFTFAVEAGNTDTDFELTSSLLVVPTVPNAQGFATAGITTTDGNLDGSTLTPGDSGSFYEASYNEGSVFANLINGPLAAGVGNGNDSAEDSGVGFSNIGVDVDSIAIAYRFNLTAGDQASGTSEFVVIPAPGAAMGLGMLGLVAARRRR